MVKIGNIMIGKSYSPKIMGIINVSPESYFKKSIKISEYELKDSITKMESEGVSIIDVGGMSTSPNVRSMISSDNEIKRLSNAIKIIQKFTNLPISVDTTRASVAKAMISLGIDAINDVCGLKFDHKMPQVISENDIPIIIGAYDKSHNERNGISGKIKTTIQKLKESLLIAKRYNISAEKIILDPSIGFFRNDVTNNFFTKITDMPWYLRDLEVISNLEKITNLNKPVCISISNKSFIGTLFNLKPDERLIPSIIFEMISVLKGANLIRTHNFSETSLALSALNTVN